METSLVIQTSVHIKSFSGRGVQRSHHSLKHFPVQMLWQPRHFSHIFNTTKSLKYWGKIICWSGILIKRQHLQQLWPFCVAVPPSILPVHLSHSNPCFSTVFPPRFFTLAPWYLTLALPYPLIAFFLFYQHLLHFLSTRLFTSSTYSRLNSSSCLPFRIWLHSSVDLFRACVFTQHF